MEKKIKILIIDDDEAARGIYADVFRRSNFEVSEAKDGLEGLEMATKDIPDVIFTGIIMPRMDGFALKEALAKNVATSSIPVYISSHMGREEDRKKAMEIGAKDFIVQGMISPRQVADEVKSLFETKDYSIKFSASELDAPKLAEDFHFSQKFECPKCYAEMVMMLKVSDIGKQEFSAKFVCPKCG